MPKRKAISKKQRFEVLKRDSFTCQYCGAKAPEAILHIDHIKPVYKNGKNDVLNLITSCDECNFGKGKRELSDSNVLEKQLDQLEKLNEKREQIELMVKWREGLYKLDEKILEIALKHWKELSLSGWNKLGGTKIKNLIKKYGLQCVLDSMDISADQYLKYEDENEDEITDSSWQYAFNKIKGICYYRSLNDEDRDKYRTIGRIKKIAEHNFSYYDKVSGAIIVRNFVDSGGNLKELEEITRASTNWSIWKDKVEGVACQIE